MNLFKNYSLKSGFNVINISVVVLIISIVFFFILTLNRIQKYINFNEDINQLKLHHLNLRRFEGQFLNRYNDDDKFFVTGENIYVSKTRKESENIKLLIDSLLSNRITKKIKLTEILQKIKIINADYIIIFDELSEKIYKKGNFKTGLTGDLKTTGQELQRLSSNPEIINEINLLLNNYLITNDEIYYTKFLKIYHSYAPAIEISQNLPENIDTAQNLSKSPTINSGSNYSQTFHRLKSQFTTLVKLNETIGLSYDHGLRESLRVKSHEFDEPLLILSKQTKENLIFLKTITIRNVIILMALFIIIFFLFFLRFSGSILKPLFKLGRYIEPLSQGILPDENPDIEGKNEISNINKAVKNLVEGLKKVTAFAISIGQRKYQTDYRPLSSKDELGNALLEMRHNLMIANEEEEKRKIDDEIRAWQNTGLTKFNDILRQNQGNIKQMSSAVISELVKFINANQGGIFVFNDDPEDKYLELTATYAYGQEKKKQKIIYPGEGLLGTASIEKETVYLTDIPESYITITSGLGGANPRSILIVPMIIEEEVIGVIELASFNHIEKHEIEFVEILSSNIASSLSITKINQRTAILLEQSQKQAEIMKIQEEEMRQNFEELQQVQEESSKRAAEMSSILAAIDVSSPVFNLDISGKITAVNKQLLTMTESPESIIVGKYHKDFILPESEEAYNIFWQQLLNGQNIQKEEHIIMEDKELWLSVVYRPIIDDSGKILYILAVATNLTDYKKLELELKEKIAELNIAQKDTNRKQSILENTNEMLKANEKTLQSAVENAMKQRKELAKRVEEIAEQEATMMSQLEGINQTNITIEINLKGEIISSNKIFEKVFEYIETEVLNQKLEFLFYENYTSSDNYKKLWSNLLSGIHMSGNFNFKGKNNKKLFIQGTYTAIKDRNNKTEKIFFLGFDTTDLVIKTEELKARETELFFQVEDMKFLQEQLIQQQEELTLKSLQIAEKEAVSESRLEGINQTNIIVEFDREKTIINVNDIFAKTFNYTKEELLNQKHDFILPQQYTNSKEYSELWDSIDKSKHVSGTFNFKGKDKKKLFLQGTYSIIKDAEEKTSKVVFMGNDTTELVLKTEELKARETELHFQIEDMKLLQEQSMKQQEELTLKSLQIAEKEAISVSRLEGINQTNIIIEFNLDKTIIGINGNFSKLFDYIETEIINKSHNVILPEQYVKSKSFTDLWNNLLNANHVSGTFQMKDRKNKSIYLQGTYTVIKGISDKPETIVFMGYDTTELLMRSEELRARETELEFRLEELNELAEKLKNK